jgi:predicted permease
MRALGQGSVPRLREIGIDLEVLLFTLGISVCSGLIFGLVPSLRVSRVDLQGQLRDAARTMAGAGALWARGQKTRRLLVVAELALSVMLLIGAGLLIRSFARLLDVPPGFNPARTLTLELSMVGRRYTDAETVIQTYRQIWDRLRAIPSVTSSGAVSALPLSQMFAWGPITVEGRAPQPGEAFINVDQRFVGGDYFETMEIPLIRGRRFNEHDSRVNPRVTIIDQRMADQLWPGQDPLGRRIKTGGADAKTPWITVVGVVGNVKQYTLDGDSRMAMYLAHAQYPVRGMNLVLRSEQPPAEATAAVRQALREIDPDLPIYRVRTMEQRVDESLARRRFAMVLLGLFATIALGLASLGIYGVMAYLVAQGTRELGIRLALGATPRQVLHLIVAGGMTVAAAGIGVGLAGAWMASGLMRTLLFGVDARDPVTFVVIPVLLAGVALVACYLPARRAMRIDPAVCLRAE